MKYLLIALIYFSIITPVYAAKTVSGTVPNLPPLQAPAPGVTPNFNKNIESSDKDQYGEAQTPQTSANGSVSQNQTSNQPGNSAVAAGVPPAPSKPNFLVLLALLIIGAAALSWAWLRRNKI